MEAYIQLGLLLLASIFLALILFETWMKRRRYKVADISLKDLRSRPVDQVIKEANCSLSLAPSEPVLQATSSLTTSKKEMDPANPILVLSVLAKPNTRFASYELLQAITATGMQFGEMNIFHYYLPSNEGRKALFSLASATKPGEFNLDNMGDFSCVGLTLFMDMRETTDVEFAFNLMLKTAEQLADDLDGELRAGVHTPWNAQVLQQYQQNITDFLVRAASHDVN
jgi:cell division protein ZipA